MPPTRARYALVLAPLLAALAVAFGALQLYTAVVALRGGNIGFAIIYSLMGVGGVALGIALWTARRRLKPPQD